VWAYQELIMDPLSITSACVALATTIGKVSIQANDFIRHVREARRDIDAVSREMGSIKTVLEVIADDDANPEVVFPPYLQNQISSIVTNCGLVVGQIQKSLDTYTGESLRNGLKWALRGREEMDQLRLSLEAHKSALEIALDLVTMCLPDSCS
jgi:Fungal N-terminal domain of STAND proteins